MTHVIHNTLTLLIVMMSGCAISAPANPSFPATFAQGDAALEQMHDNPRPLQRPVVIVGGFLDPGLGGSFLKSKLSPAIHVEPAVDIVVGFDPDFDAARQHLIDAVQKAAPSDDPNWTTEVDVIGISMGGLVARYAAFDTGQPNQRRLKIARLFTLGTPHQGANLAALPAFFGTQKQMRKDSDFLHRLNAQPASYPIYPYARLGDLIVGPANTAPPGQDPIWMSPGLIDLPHMGCVLDPRIVADIARRLRDEQPLQIAPSTALPAS